MTINSKRKGNRAELEAAKLLSKITGDKFSRVGVSSGARKNFGNKTAEDVFAGDLIVPDDCPFCVECKSGYGLRIRHLIFGSAKIDGFVEQADADAERVEKIPLVLVKVEEHWWFIIHNEDVVEFSEYFYGLHGWISPVSWVSKDQEYYVGLLEK